MLFGHQTLNIRFYFIVLHGGVYYHQYLQIVLVIQSLYVLLHDLQRRAPKSVLNLFYLFLQRLGGQDEMNVRNWVVAVYLIVAEEVWHQFDAVVHSL